MDRFEKWKERALTALANGDTQKEPDRGELKAIEEEGFKLGIEDKALSKRLSAALWLIEADKLLCESQRGQFDLAHWRDKLESSLKFKD